ncbi:MAG: tetratricopeptide repeat protein [Tagaea sp.]|nr:tetratricopeptide repeat protein [Tagaea sp.]
MSLERALELHRGGRLDEARALYDQALAADPDDVNALNLAGQIDLNRAEYAAAFAKFVRARTREPAFVDAWMNEGNALRALGRPLDALAAFDRAAALAPDHALIACNLGLAKLDLGDAAGAVAAIERAARLMPGEPMIQSNLAVALKAANRPHAALGLFEAIGSPGNAAAVRQDLLDHAGARMGYAIALSAEPGRADVESNRLFAANYDPDATAEQIKALYAAWGARQTQPALPHANDRAPDRRLRVGFVSADFRVHSVRHFLWPLIANFPAEEAELVAYANFAGDGDAWTARYRARFDLWRSCAHLNDEALDGTIRADAIDVLVDLSGHTQGNRLGAFARKPAPVQVSWLGYGGTTGLAAIDWYIGDARLAPPGAESAFVEGVWRLPRTGFVYAPQDAMPDIAPLPMLAHGYPTFGSFSRTVRYNARCFRLWARLLDAIPDARLVLNALVFGEDATAKLFARRFAEWGGDASRLELIATSPQPATWEAYARLDVALDAFPHNGGATTFEALWMGVPSVSKRDRPPLGRFGDSILGACGLGDWVVDDDDAYIARARAAVADPKALAELRLGLRDRIKASALGDETAYARDFAGALRAMWRRYCA